MISALHFHFSRASPPTLKFSEGKEETKSDEKTGLKKPPQNRRRRRKKAEKVSLQSTSAASIAFRVGEQFEL